MTQLQVDIEVASDGLSVPGAADIERWISAALSMAGRLQQPEAEVSLYVVDEEEGRELNLQYRNKDYPTNVLSFPADLPEELALPLLGDLVVCAPVVEREAREQDKLLTAHWAHMLVHGTLHLLGFDHIEDAEADEMEALETRILAQLGFADPYAAEKSAQS